MLDANEPKINEGVEWGILEHLEKHCPATVSAPQFKWWEIGLLENMVAQSDQGWINVICSKWPATRYALNCYERSSFLYLNPKENRFGEIT